MRTFLFVPLLSFLLGSNAFLPSNLVADEAELKQILENPNDAKALLSYLKKEVSKISRLIPDDPDAAEKEIEALQKTLDKLKPENKAAERYVNQGKAVMRRFIVQVELARIKIEDLENRLKEDADDTKTIQQYISKIVQQVSPIARTNPTEAEKQLLAGKEFLASLKEKVTDKVAKTTIEGSSRAFVRLEKTIQSAIKIAALIGEAALEFKIEDWANGTSLTDADLKGKVVLLDFWAVWCGPCIKTFPHLRDWHDKYSEQGLVIIGLTRYYNYVWDEKAGRATRSTKKVSPEDEQEMLKKFAELHDLQHSFAIQSDRTISDYYAVSGIPHVVLIDREGKIRDIKVGSRDENAIDIEAKIKEALAVKESM